MNQERRAFVTQDDRWFVFRLNGAWKRHNTELFGNRGLEGIFPGLSETKFKASTMYAIQVDHALHIDVDQAIFIISSLEVMYENQRSGIRLDKLLPAAIRKGVMISEVESIAIKLVDGCGQYCAGASWPV